MSEVPLHWMIAEILSESLGSRAVPLSVCRPKNMSLSVRTGRTEQGLVHWKKGNDRPKQNGRFQQAGDWDRERMGGPNLEDSSERVFDRSLDAR